MDERNPFRCFDLRFMATAIGAALGILGLAFLSRGFPRGSAPRVAIAVAEGLVAAGLLGVMVRAVFRLDEMHRRLHVEAAAIAFVVTAAVATILGFVEPAAGWSLPWGVAAWPAMTIAWAIAATILRRRLGA